MQKLYISILFSLLFAPNLLAAETRYITDIFEVTMRSGTSTSNSIVRLLGSGEAVTLLEEDDVSKYSLVETAEGKQGYVITRFLMETPAARETLTKLQVDYQRQSEQLEQQKTHINELTQALEQEQNDLAALKIALSASEQELGEVRQAAADTLSILEQNRALETAVFELREEKSRLTEENMNLKDSSQMDWFIRGAAVALVAFLIGILITRIRWRKQDSWGSY